MLLFVAITHSFSSLYSGPLCISSTVDGHLEYFQLEAIMEDTAWNVVARLLVPFCTHFSSAYTEEQNSWLMGHTHLQLYQIKPNCLPP